VQLGDEIRGRRDPKPEKLAIIIFPFPADEDSDIIIYLEIKRKPMTSAPTCHSAVSARQGLALVLLLPA
jgi:hypothetical protein